MKFTKSIILICVLIPGLLTLCGCEKNVDESKPLDQIKTEAENMSIEKLRAKAMEYKDAIMSKKAEIDKLSSKIDEIPVTEMMGEEAKQLKSDLDDLNQSISALQERFEVYYNQLKEQGGDLSGLKNMM
jgi:peptidoglycan hydrolase CwlO-like protein